MAEEPITAYVAVSMVKNQSAGQHYGEWWKDRLKGKRLNAVSPSLLEEAQRELTAESLAAQAVVHYMKFFRHIFNKAVRDGKLEKNPFTRVKQGGIRQDSLPDS